MADAGAPDAAMTDASAGDAGSDGAMPDGGAIDGGALDSGMSDGGTDAGDAASACDLDERACDGDCVPAMSNPQHCGACGNPCMTTEVCALDRCASASWALRLGSPGRDVVTDHDGNVYVIVSPASGSTATVTDPPLPGTGSYAALLVSYDAAGSYRWAVGFATTDYLYMSAGLAIDSHDRLYLAGSFETDATFEGMTLTGVGTRDTFVASYSAGGALRWLQRFGGTGAAVQPGDLAVDADDNVYLTGGQGGTVDYGGGDQTASGPSDMFILALDAGGAHRWSQTLGNAQEGLGNAVVADGMGRVTVAGYFVGEADFGGGPITSPPGSAETLLLGLDRDGAYRWSTFYGGTGIDIPDDLGVDATGNVFLIGAVQSSTTGIDLGGGALPAVSGTNDVVIASYTAAGAYRWAELMGSSGLDYAYGLVVNAAGDPIATGEFFGPEGHFGGTPLPGAAGYDVWVAARSGADGSPRWARRFGADARESGNSLALSPLGPLLLTGAFGTEPVDFTGTTLTGARDPDGFLLSFQP